MAKSTGTMGYTILMMGSVFLGIGVVISFTGIGACLGIPMVLVAIPMIIFGAISHSRARQARVDAVIASSIEEGLDKRMPPPSQGGAIYCSSCGNPATTGSAFCASCGAKLS